MENYLIHDNDNGIEAYVALTEEQVQLANFLADWGIICLDKIEVINLKER